MECDVSAHASGFEIRFTYCGELYHSHVHVNRSQADREADEKRRELIALGWTENQSQSTP